ncbi:carboxylesterase/lipase family protein [Sphingopyxis panaciterrae]
MKRLLHAALLWLACLPPPVAAQEGAIVKTSHGALAGQVLDDGSRVFRGVPYAAPPVGAARWRPPAPAADWAGARDATHFGPACVQPKSSATSIYASDLPAMSEDCLTLNIWAPKAVRKAAVMVWLHGGSLVSGHGGSPFFDGARLAREGVIAVTINYRLGIFGFLAHPELSAESPHHASGNYGLLDQVAALEWVRDNIAAFGGDPDNVTVFGESAGALSVAYLLASPLADGLFHKAIAQSPYLVPTPELKSRAYGMLSGEEIGLQVAEKLGAANLEALRAIDAAMLNALPPQGGPVPQATVDGWFLHKQLLDVFDAGDQAQVPLIAGFNSGEIRSLRGLAPPVPASVSAYEAAIRAQYGDLAARYLDLYPATDLADTILAATRDAIYGWSAERLVAKQVNRGVPSYLYYFDHSYPASEALNLGAFHAAEVPYVFGAAGTDAPLPPNWPRPPVDAGERKLSQAMLSYWTTFAKYGSPSAPGEPIWRPYADGRAYMGFRGHAEASVNLLPGHYALAEEVKCRRRAAGQTWIPMIASVPARLPASPCSGSDH